MRVVYGLGRSHDKTRGAFILERIVWAAPSPLGTSKRFLRGSGRRSSREKVISRLLPSLPLIASRDVDGCSFSCCSFSSILSLLYFRCSSLKASPADDAYSGCSLLRHMSSPLLAWLVEGSPS